MADMRRVRVLTVTPANESVTITVPADATPEQMMDAAAERAGGGLCHYCNDTYELGDGEVYLIIDDKTDEEIWTSESEPASTARDAVEAFRAALVTALKGAESQAMGLPPSSGDWLGAMADFVADFEPED